MRSPRPPRRPGPRRPAGVGARPRPPRRARSPGATTSPPGAPRPTSRCAGTTAGSRSSAGTCCATATTRVGSAKDNDVVLDAAIAPPHLGDVRVGERHVHARPRAGVDDASIRRRRRGVHVGARSRPIPAARDGCRGAGSSLQVIRRDDGQAVLRVADNESPHRASVRRPRLVRPARVARAPGDVHALPEGHEDHDRQRAERDLAGGRGRPRRVHDRTASRTRSTRSTTTATCSSSSATRPARTRPTRPGRFLYIEKPKDGSGRSTSTAPTTRPARSRRTPAARCRRSRTCSRRASTRARSSAPHT